MTTHETCTVDSKKLKYGCRVVYACVPSFFGSGIRGWSCSNFLAFTVGGGSAGSWVSGAWFQSTSNSQISRLGGTTHVTGTAIIARCVGARNLLRPVGNRALK